MHAFKKALFAALFVVSGCGMRKAPAVLIDRWWAMDQARLACKAAHLMCADPENPGEVRGYIVSLKSEFATAPVCQGVRVVEYLGPNSPWKNMPVHYEQLIIDYRPYETVQKFHIMGEPTKDVSGSGTVEDIVKRACVAARGLGAKVE